LAFDTTHTPLTSRRGRCLLAALFALALMLQTTCNAFCLTSFPSRATLETVLLAPNCHHGSHAAASNGKSDECHHPRLSDAPAIQSKPSPSTLVHAPILVPAIVMHPPFLSSDSETFALNACCAAVPKPFPPLRI
jgi:hypothetical protein